METVSAETDRRSSGGDAAGGPLRWLVLAARPVFSVIAVACFTAFLVVMRAVMFYLGPFYLALTKLGAGRAIAKAGLPALLFSNGALFFLCANEPPAAFAPSWTWIRLAGFPLLLVTSGMALGAVVAAPPKLEDLRTRVKTRFPERWLAPKLSNPLDAHFAVRVGAHLCVTGPAFLAMFLPQTRGIWSIVYWGISLNLVAVSHEALDHSNIHNNFFRVSHLTRFGDRLLVGGIGWFLDYVLNPICGRMPNWYRVQHVAVHHAEDNGPEDTQSTIHYDRMSYFDTAKGALRFGLSMVLPVDVVLYLAKKRRIRPLRRLVASVAGYYAALGLLALVHWPAAAAVVLMRFVFGQAGTLTYYQWHVFADPADPKNNYKSSVNNADQATDHGFVGAALHIEHHLHQARHWSQLATDAAANRSRYEAEEVLQLVNGRNNILRALWRRRFDELAPMLVGFDGRELPREDLERLVWARTRPLHGVPRAAFGDRVDRLFGSAVATCLM